jgi:uncharacterized tellurite resistance protein B-like protein
VSPINLHASGWLHQLLTLYIETYDPSRAQEAVAIVREECPGAPPDALASHLVRRRLERIGLRPSRHSLSRALAERLGVDDLARDDAEAIGLMSTGWDVLQDIAWLHQNTSGPVEAELEMLTVMALGLKDYPLARRLHHLLLDELSSTEEVDAAPLAAEVESQLAPKGKLPHSQAALSIGIGLAYFEARALGRIASMFYERAAIEEDGIEKLHALTEIEKVRLVEVLVRCAWADGKIVPEERQLIEQQVELADVDGATAMRLLAMLETRPEENTPLEPTDGETRRFLLEQAILLSLVDDDQADEELEAVRAIASQLGGTAEELDGILVEVAAFYERNRDLIRDFGPVSGALGRLRRLVVDKVAHAVRSNMRKLVQEIKETGELAKLLGVASIRELTPAESSKVKSQLLDICKTVPALAIFLLPGGGFLIPVLIKLLPFNILPTAFGDETSPAG